MKSDRNVCRSFYLSLPFFIEKKMNRNSIIGILFCICIVQCSGIATLIANILYFALSLIIVMPNLEWKVPYFRLMQIAITFIPVSGLCYLLKTNTNIHPWIQMSILLISYFAVFCIVRLFKKDDRYVI